MKMKNCILVLGASLLLFSSCRESKVEAALRLAGENRAELERVLEHFDAGGDKEMAAAARFIVGNMPGHKSMWGDYEAYWKEADRMLAASDGSQSVLDSLELLKAKYDGKVFFDYDIRRITADYLIHDIETAFAQWREVEWARNLTFDEFCEWLLPYTCTDSQPLIPWRDSLAGFARGFIDHLNECDEFIGNPRAAITRVNNKLIPMIAKQKWIHSGHGFPIFDPSVFVKLPGASCDEYMCMGILILRSKGIPVGMDYTPQFSDRQYGHYWNVFPNIRGRNTVFTSFGINPDYPHYAQAKFAKILRRTYSPNEEYLKLLSETKGDIPQMFDSPFFKDVTDEYQETSDLKIPLLPGTHLSRPDVYLCVFDNTEWKPVTWGKVRFGKARFKKLGRNITYMAFGYVDGNFEAVSRPFFLDVFGNVDYIGGASSGNTASFRLRRKYPMFQHVMLTQTVLHGGLVLGSDDIRFSCPDTVCVLPDWELTSGIVPSRSQTPHRYWRFCSNLRSVSDMAELYFFDKDGKPVEMKADSDSLGFLVDGDPLTYFSARRSSPSGVLDAGEPVELSHISYIRRGDGNAIVPGDSYRISWWNGKGWTTHAEVDAEDVELAVEGIPEGELYYVEGLSRGVQNRIFNYPAGASRPLWR